MPENETYFIGLHNMNKAMDSSSSVLKWHSGEVFDPAIPLSAAVELSISAGHYCMTVRLDIGSNKVILEDESCTAEVAAITELNCLDLGKTREKSK